MCWIDSLKVKVKMKLLSRVGLFVIPWTVAHQAPPSMEFSRQEYWSGLPFPFPGDLPDPGFELGPPYCKQTLNCLSHLESPSDSLRKPHSFGEYLLSVCILQDKYEIHAQYGFIILILLTWSVKKKVVCV